MGASSTETSCLQSAMTKFQLTTGYFKADNDLAETTFDSLQANNDPMSTNNGRY